MDFSNIIFKRKFSMSMYKDQQILLGKMTFTKDFVQDIRGDLYPVIRKSDTCTEAVENNQYTVKSGAVQRWFCAFFPFATYEISVKDINGSVGFSFHLPGAEVTVALNRKSLCFVCGEIKEEIALPEYVDTQPTMLVSCRPGAFDVFFKLNGGAQFFHTFSADAFANSNQQAVFSNGYAAIYAEGNAVIEAASAYIDNGISQADIRPIRYENGEVMVENGKVYLTASLRMQEEMFQGVFSWVPGTAEIELTGAIFYDAGDGKWCGDVAASILYHRECKQYYLWVCSFNHGHILAHAIFDGDVRFGVNVVDITLMEKADAGAHISVFAGFEGDEDPDFFYDEAQQKWLMAVCRPDPATRQYRYVFFESDQPFAGYTYIGNGVDGAETGGSFVKIHGEQLFVCGNDFNAVSNYRIYGKGDMQNAKFDFPDGGFRGWGTLMPLRCGSRTRYFWITFDRHNGSNYNWSYGNIYCFEAEI